MSDGRALVPGAAEFDVLDVLGADDVEGGAEVCGGEDVRAAVVRGASVTTRYAGTVRVAE